MRISDWSSDVCSSDLLGIEMPRDLGRIDEILILEGPQPAEAIADDHRAPHRARHVGAGAVEDRAEEEQRRPRRHLGGDRRDSEGIDRSEEHTSELQSLMRISYAGFCLQKKTKQ